MKWIDATKRLPPINHAVLVCNKEGSMYISAVFMQDKLGNFVWICQTDNEKEEVVAWLEVPEAPVKREDDGLDKR